MEAYGVPGATTGAAAVPRLAYDGGQIDVQWDMHDAAAEWYCRHMGFSRLREWSGRSEQDSKQERMTELRPGLWLKSVLPDTQPNRFYAERGAAEPYVKWCHATRDLEREHAYFNSQGIRTTPVYRMPDGQELFDFWAIGGARLTAGSMPAMPKDGPRFGGSWVRMGVRHLEQARDWYERHAGMKLIEDYSAKGCYLMGLGLEGHPDVYSAWYLDQLPEDAPDQGPVDGPCRPYCATHDADSFKAYYAYLRIQGVRTSPTIAGNPDKLAFFHYYDPDGNRFNVMNY